MNYKSNYQSARLRRNRNASRFRSTKNNLGTVSSSVIIMIMLAILGLLYLTQITKTSAYGYQVNEQDQRYKELVETNQALRVEAARLQSIERIKNSDVADKLTDEDNFTYLDSSN